MGASGALTTGPAPEAPGVKAKHILQQPRSTRPCIQITDQDHVFRLRVQINSGLAGVEMLPDEKQTMNIGELPSTGAWFNQQRILPLTIMGRL